MKALFMKNSSREAIPNPRSAPTSASLSASPLAASSDSAGRGQTSPAPRRAPTKTPKTGASKPGASKPGASSPKNAESGDAKSESDAKKRVRLKPETREQLLERLRNPPLSLHETSILLRVSRATVRRYADAGRLPCLRTPGGQRRFALRDIEAFYRQLKAKR